MSVKVRWEGARGCVLVRACGVLSGANGLLCADISVEDIFKRLDGVL